MPPCTCVALSLRILAAALCNEDALLRGSDDAVFEALGLDRGACACAVLTSMTPDRAVELLRAADVVGPPRRGFAHGTLPSVMFR